MSKPGEFNGDTNERVEPAAPPEPTEPPVDAKDAAAEAEKRHGVRDRFRQSGRYLAIGGAAGLTLFAPRAAGEAPIMTTPERTEQVAFQVTDAAGGLAEDKHDSEVARDEAAEAGRADDNIAEQRPPEDLSPSGLLPSLDGPPEGLAAVTPETSLSDRVTNMAADHLSDIDTHHLDTFSGGPPLTVEERLAQRREQAALAVQRRNELGGQRQQQRRH